MLRDSAVPRFAPVFEVTAGRGEALDAQARRRSTACFDKSKKLILAVSRILQREAEAEALLLAVYGPEAKVGFAVAGALKFTAHFNAGKLGAATVAAE